MTTEDLAEELEAWAKMCSPSDRRTLRAAAARLRELSEALDVSVSALDQTAQALAEGAATGLRAAAVHRERQRVIKWLRAARAAQLTEIRHD